MQIKVTSVMVDDQEKALAFYTGKLGFRKMADIAMGPTYRWLTVVSPEGIAGLRTPITLSRSPTVANGAAPALGEGSLSWRQ